MIFICCILSDNGKLYSFYIIIEWLFAVRQGLSLSSIIRLLAVGSCTGIKQLDIYVYILVCAMLELNVLISQVVLSF